MSRALVFCVLIYALALTVSINGSSLWTDEAFSAWLASHQSLRSLSGSLFHGDSSDLQMGLYYLCLFLWAKVFGTSEYALRAANIPFILLFSFALIWPSWTIFRSRIAWIAPALLPFIWHYAGEARPYMAILALSTAAVSSLLSFAVGANTKKTPWVCLGSILIGSCFHMLCLLVVPPIALLAFVSLRHRPRDDRWQYWIPPLKIFALPFGLLAVYLVFTFARGTAYDYPQPGLRQAFSVLYDLSGISGFGPNRKFSLDFKPYLVPLGLGATFLVIGALAAFNAARRITVPFLTGLSAALCLALFEVVVLSVALRKQIDVRHLAAIIPLILFLLIAVLAQQSTWALASLVLFASGWLGADARLALLPEYQKEDYRGAVTSALSIQRRTGAAIAVAADPLGAAYYGMDLRGAAPCYPIRQSCRESFAKVPWPREAPAFTAEQWSQSSIEQWLANEKRAGIPVLVFLQRDRAHLTSAWWPVLEQTGAPIVAHVHGFDVELVGVQ